MKELPNLFGRATAIQADHEHLRASWTHLQQLVAGLNGAPPTPEAWTAASDFAAELRTHFAAEEVDYIGGLVAALFSLERRVERLRSDHRAINQLFDQLLALEKPEVIYEDFAARAAMILIRVQRHEYDERALVGELFRGRDAVPDR